MDNTVNDLRYEIKFENCVKVKRTFVLSEPSLFSSQQNIYFFHGDKFFFKIAKNLIACSVFIYFFFSVKADTKNHRFASAKSSNAALVKLTDLIIKNDHAIVCCFCVSDKYRQTTNVIWLSTA